MPGVLILDDREDNLFSMAAILAREPYPVHTESNPNNLMNQLTALQPSLLVLDLILPGNFNGLDLAEQIRQTTPAEQMPIIAVTAGSETYTRQMALEAGCDSYLAKPFNVREFRDEVNRLLPE
ncbi:MAG: response regulator [Chloroflexota bacterium]